MSRLATVAFSTLLLTTSVFARQEKTPAPKISENRSRFAQLELFIWSRLNITAL
jgi:hypothetical protein